MKYIILSLALVVTPALAADSKNMKPPNHNAAAIDSAYIVVNWDELVPKDWDPAKAFRKLNLSALTDNDPRAMEALELMKREWDSAPINPAFDGKKVRIPGFVVPLEEKGRAVTEFLLVPYFGACIHVPPPPANQIIHVVSPKPIPNLRMMDVVWVAGELKAGLFAKEMPMGLGASSYRIDSVLVTPYKEGPMVTITRTR